MSTKAKVLTAIESGARTSIEIAEMFDINLKSVQCRLGELRAIGVLKSQNTGFSDRIGRAYAQWVIA